VKDLRVQKVRRCSRLRAEEVRFRGASEG